MLVKVENKGIITIGLKCSQMAAIPIMIMGKIIIYTSKEVEWENNDLHGELSLEDEGFPSATEQNIRI